jgi:nicotinamidase-related amidase
MFRHSIFIAASLLLSFSLPAFAQEKQLTLSMRSRVEDKGAFNVAIKKQTWPTDKAAIIVCDMWDAHHCLNAVRREEEMVPRMNDVLEKARSQGVFIIHAPSSCMDAYKDYPGRKRALAASKSGNLPTGIDQWCRQIPAEEKGKYPIDQTDGGEDDDLKEHAEWHAKLKAMGRNPNSPWKRQHAGLKPDPGGRER